MTSGRWQRTKEIVADALEKSGDERTAFVVNECAHDLELEREVNSILAHADDETRFGPAMDDLQRVRSASDGARAGQIVGAYRITREIGRGGMGAVYLGERADAQFEKQVALKILKRGTDTDEVLRRFQTERRILARLEHPNIAQLIDGGTTEDGLPYFALQFVRGLPITTYCDAQKLDARARVALFLKVCAAVEFAHRNLIVHRDLKPGNVLVTDEGEPQLLDFGIAKLLEAGEETALVTIENRQRLTPGYASPEQVRGESITTSSDVYSLGALLHELLTGRSPHRFTSATPSPTELQRVIGEQEIARTDLPADLDTILRTALRKEPERRYSGVTALADDLRRYLDGRPVQARPSTFGYRASKFVRRNKLGVAAAVLLIASLLGGIVATSWQARKAQRRFDQVRQLANLFIFKYHDSIAALPGSTELRRQLVKDALDYLDNLALEGTSDPALLRELGTAYKRIGDVQGGLLTNMVAGGMVTSANLGNTAGALENYEKARALRERLSKLRPHDPEIRFELAEIHGNLGQVEITAGKPAEAAAHFRTEAAVLRSMLTKTPTDRKILAELRDTSFNLASTLAIEPANLGDIPGALQALREATVIGETLVAQEPQNVPFLHALAASYGNTGRVHMDEGDPGIALEYYRKAHAIGERLARENLQMPIYRRELALQNRNLGRVHLERGDAAAALAHFHTAVELFEGLMAADPNDVRLRRSAAYGYRDLGEALSASGDQTRARENLERALRMFDEIASNDPQNAIVVFQQALSHLKLSRFFLATRNTVEARASGERALASAQKIAERSGKDVNARKLLAEAQAQMGYCLIGPEARRAFLQSIALWRELEAGKNLNPRGWQKLAEAERALAHLMGLDREATIPRARGKAFSKAANGEHAAALPNLGETEAALAEL